MKKIVAILGSPRRWGNTELLLEEFLKEFRDKKFKIKKIVASELDITPCNNCGYCLKKAKCIFADDMKGVYKELKEADCVIMASPVYFTNIPGQLKILVDRCQVFWAKVFAAKKTPKPKHRRNRKYGVFLSVCGSPFPRMFNCSVRLTRIFFKVINAEFYGKVAVASVDKKGDILKNEEAFVKARRLARKLKKEVYKTYYEK